MVNSQQLALTNECQNFQLCQGSLGVCVCMYLFISQCFSFVFSLNSHVSCSHNNNGTFLDG